MVAIPKPPEKAGSSAKGASAWNLLGLLAVIALVGGGAAYLYMKPPAFLTTLLQPAKATPEPALVTGGKARVDTTPLAEASQGHVWLFDEDEWRTPADAKNDFKEGLVHVRTVMEKPQPTANGEIRARIVIREGGGMAGIFMRSTPEEGRYRLAIDPDLRFVRLVHEGPKGTEELGKYRFFKSLMRGDRLTLELRADRERISGTVNGERVIEADDASCTKAGTWGIESSDGLFELVEVPIPPAKVAEAAPPPEPAAPAPAPAAPAAPAMPEPPPAPAVQTSETGKWLASTEPQWQASYQQEVVAPFEKAAGDLKKQYQGTIETQLAAATQANLRDDAAYFRGEKKRLEAGEDVPMTDEVIVPAALVKLRTNFRGELARLDKARFDRAKILFARIDALLAQTQAALVARKRNDEVAEVQKKREQLTAQWLKPPMTATAPATPAPKAAGTPAPKRPLGAAATPAMSKTPPKQVVEKLLAMGAGVWIGQRVPINLPNQQNSTEVKTITDVSGDRFIITHVDFRRNGEEEKPITTEDLDIVEALPEVTDLDFHGPSVTDAVVEKLRTLRHLTRLTIEGAKITPASAMVIGALTDLKELHLAGVAIGDAGIKAVGQCHRLERLSLDGVSFGDDALVPIVKLPALQELSMSNIDKLTAAGYAHLAECHSLKRLSLGGANVVTSMVAALGKCTTLESLNLSGIPLSDDALAGLSGLSRLKTLSLNNTGLVGTGFTSWPTHTAMTSLDLTNEPGVNDAALKAIGTAFPKLESLQINGAPLGATAVGFASIAHLRGLKTLRVSGGLVNDEVMAEIGKCNDLQSLSIPGGRLGEPGAAAMAKLSKLTSLDLNDPPVTDAALKSFGKCKALKSIQIGAEATEDVEKKLKAALSGVTIRKG